MQIISMFCLKIRAFKVKRKNMQISTILNKIIIVFRIKIEFILELLLDNYILYLHTHVCLKNKEFFRKKGTQFTFIKDLIGCLLYHTEKDFCRGVDPAKV
jgi:hypothetical protein